MFDEDIWNQPFPFASGPINDAKVQSESGIFLDLLDETFLEDATGSYEEIKLTSEYHVKTTLKMSKIVESARRQQASQATSSNAPTCFISENIGDISLSETTSKSEILTKRERGAEGALKTTKAAKAKKAKPNTVTVTYIPPLNKTVQLRTRYVDMYVNVMNSGSFTTIQKFLYKFVSRRCKMENGYDVRSNFRIPKLAHAEGPIVMAHFFLGCLVMYPDLLVELKGSSTISSDEGRKIVLRVMTHATKSVHIPLEEWIPANSSLQDTYQRFLEAPLSHTEQQANKVEAELQEQIEGSKHIQHFSLEVPLQPLLTTTNGYNGTSALSDVEPEQSVSSNNSVASVSSLSSTQSCHNLTHFEDIPLIPESYIKTLYSKARLLPTPSLLVMKGTITLQLDQMDHICDIKSDFVQVNIV